MKKALKEKWEKLYESAMNVVRLKPWSWIDEEKLLIVKAYEGLDFYMSIMGFHGMFEGIMLCTSKNALCNYSEMQASMIPDLYGINYQEGILMVYNKEKYSLPENAELAESFMPRKINNKIITFESFVKGYFPSSLTEEELDDEIIAIETLEKTLQSFETAKKERNKKAKELKELKDTFINDEDKCLIMSYNEDNETLDIDVIDEPEIYDYSPTIQLTNETREFLKDAARSNKTYEIEFLNYMPIPIGKVKYKTPIMNETIEKNQLLRYCIIANETDKQIIKFEPYEDAIMSNKEEMEYITLCMDKIVEIFKEYGIPEKIFIRDEETAFALDGVTKEFKIETVINPKLDVIDDFMYGFFEHITGEDLEEFESMDEEEFNKFIDNLDDDNDDNNYYDDEEDDE